MRTISRGRLAPLSVLFILPLMGSKECTFHGTVEVTTVEETGDTGVADTDTDVDTDTGACVPVAETCDGLDQDCDGVADNGLDDTYYVDTDGDSFGNPNASIVVHCDQVVGVGLVLDDTDCDDTDANVNPDATEVGGNGVDEDCDPNNDGDGCVDADGDGFTDIACGGTDCNDDPATGVNTFPGAAENQYLNPASHFTDPLACMKDDDGDGYGDAYPWNLGPDVVPGTDCYDGPGCIVADCSIVDPNTGDPIEGDEVYYNSLDPEANHIPGNDYPESCEPYLDEDGDGYCNSHDEDGIDTDGDGATDDEAYCFFDDLPGDCENPDPAISYDDDASVNPGVAEVAGDGKDNDCDGLIDENGGLAACAAGTSRVKFVYVSEAGATSVMVSTEMNNTGMFVVTEGMRNGVADPNWHMTSVLDAVTNVTTVTVWDDACTADTTLWQASASFGGIGGAWSCTGAAAPFTTHGTWQAYEDDVLSATTYVSNGLGGCELEVQ